MSPDLPEGSLGIGVDDPAERRLRETDEEEGLERFCIIYVGDHRLAMPVDAVKAITDRPTEMTRIPRSPPAIEGVSDLRGEITVIIDPYVHFPDCERPADDPTLLVLDPPTDEQSAAIMVDDVVGVETVPEGNVLEESAFTDAEIEASPLAHPLIVGVVKQETRTQSVVHEVLAAESTSDGASATEDSAVGSGLKGFVGERLSDVEVGEFTLGDDESDSWGEQRANTRVEDDDEVEIEVTPLVDVERLLLASGRPIDGDAENR